MKIVEKVEILAVGQFPNSDAWLTACAHVETAVKATDWPHGTGSFIIYPQSGKKRGEGNGVGPIKIPALQKLRQLAWQTEQLPPIPNSVLTTGDLDALYRSKSGYIGFEWETGNISSSHRAINKLLLTLKKGGLVGGFMVVPSNVLAAYLTDRIGNIGELRHYFPLWRDTRITEGALQIIVVEQDGVSLDVPRIPKGTDGRAMA
jgi:Restriction endonuclease BamHI